MFKQKMHSCTKYAQETILCRDHKSSADKPTENAKTSASNYIAENQYNCPDVLESNKQMYTR